MTNTIQIHNWNLVKFTKFTPITTCEHKNYWQVSRGSYGKWIFFCSLLIVSIVFLLNAFTSAWLIFIQMLLHFHYNFIQFFFVRKCLVRIAFSMNSYSVTIYLFKWTGCLTFSYLVLKLCVHIFFVTFPRPSWHVSHEFQPNSALFRHNWRACPTHNKTTTTNQLARIRIVQLFFFTFHFHRGQMREKNLWNKFREHTACSLPFRIRPMHLLLFACWNAFERARFIL